MVRKYKKEDMETIMKIGNLAWQAIYKQQQEILGEELFRIINPDPLSAKGEQIRKYTEKFPDRMLICERNNRIAGFLTLMLESPVGEIGNNAVDPSCGEKGVGQEMYQAAFAWFKEKGCIWIKVATGLDEAHTPARRAYERAGFNIHQESILYFRKI
ncbi:MAG: hypothetical protein A2096_02200 [Spirochaetes bacterium GWF1_41_5]|nr:MAG: hypothetical protein A2096_02200 [Spirochaetes bacterium GWF1_41_5]